MFMIFSITCYLTFHWYLTEYLNWKS